MQKSANYNKLAMAFVAVNAFVWWLLFSTGRASLDTYGDMAEAYAWGISWQWGYDKHPPLSAWTAAAWFELFPTSDWAYYLLAMLNQGIAFWFLFLAGKRWLTPSQALLAVMLTSLIPLFGPDTGFKYNANSAMLPWLAIFAWSLIASLQTGSHRYIISAGVAAGAACLVKYWAPVMLLSIGFGALLITDQRLASSWRTTPTKLLSIVGISAVVFVPHMSWAVNHQWPGLQYAQAAHSLTGNASITNAMLDVLFDLFLVALLPVVAWMLCIGYVSLTGRQRIPAYQGQTEQRPRKTRMWSSASFFVFAVLLTVLSACLAGVALATKWLIPAWLFFSWFLCSVMPKKLDARRLIGPLGAVIGVYWVGLLVYTASINPSFDITRDASNQRRTIANEVTQTFHGLFGKPLDYVAGSAALSFSTSFYSSDHPLAVPDVNFDRASWVTERQVLKAGLVVLCDAADTACAQAATRVAGAPEKTVVWQGLADDGQPAKVLELFYAPHSP